MAGLVPAIHVFCETDRKQDVDARHRRQVYAVCAQTAMAGHDEEIKKIPAAPAAGISYRIATALSYFKTIAVNG
jgi:hypothetical protein